MVGNLGSKDIKFPPPTPVVFSCPNCKLVIQVDMSQDWLCKCGWAWSVVRDLDRKVMGVWLLGASDNDEIYASFFLGLWADGVLILDQFSTSKTA